MRSHEAGLATLAKRYVKRSLVFIDRAVRRTSPAGLTQSLRRAGIRPGDTMLVHSAFGGMRYFQGGPGDALQAILDAVGPAGTVVMPAFSFAGRSFDYLNSGPAFDQLRTPARTGLICELMRRRPGVVRSLHPTHSVVALGPLAANIVAGHGQSRTPFDRCSPWQALLELNAWMVCVGVNDSLLPVTPYHHFDELMAAEYGFKLYHEHAFAVPVRDAGGRQREFVTFAHDPETGKRRNYDSLCREQLRLGVLKHWHAGAISLWAGRMQDLFETVQLLAARGLTAYT